MTKCNSPNVSFHPDLFPSVKGRKVKVDFNGGNVSSDGGLLLLKQVDGGINLLPRLASIMTEYGSSAFCVKTL